MDRATVEAALFTGAIVAALATVAMPLFGAWMDSRQTRRTCAKLGKDAVRMGREYGAVWIWRDGREA